MSDVDNRVVQMEFDNSRFERNVQTSMSTLDKLKSALNFKGASDGIMEVEKSANKLDFSSIGSAVENISSKFTVLGMIGVQALQRIINKALDAGEHLVKSMSVDQLAAGWNKYEEKTNSVKTIMAATEQTWEASAKEIGFVGTQMDYVNAQMDKLNWFTDETSYSFTDMASNIGKFTANNIPLETAVTAMQGIANWAAVSGQKAGEASRAMYNLAQAIGVGSVKLMDWKSIENANMATAGFKQKVLDVAVANGQLKKEVTKTGEAIYKTAKGTQVSVESFSQTLSEGWFNKNTLISVLNEYGSFTNKLYEFSEATGLTATDILQLIEAQEKGTLSTTDLANAAAEAGMSTEDFKKQLSELASEENRFGREAFKAAQEATTFGDAIDATKDAASTQWMNIFENIFGDYEKARHIWTDFANFLYDTLVAPLEAVNDLSEAFLAPMSKFSGLLNNVAKNTGLTSDQIIGLIQAQKEGTLSLDDLNELLGEQLTITDELTKAGEKNKEVQEALNETAKEATLSNEEFLALIEELGGDAFADFTDALFDMSEKTGISAQELYKLAEAQRSGKLTIEELTKAAEEAGMSVEELQEIITDLVKVGEMSGLEKIIAGLKNIWNYLFSTETTKSGIFGSMINGFRAVVKPIEITQDSVRGLIRRFQEFSESLEVNGIWQMRLSQAGTALGKMFNFVKNSVKNYWDATKNLRDSIGKLASSFGQLITNLFRSFRGMNDAGLQGETFGKICDFIANIINKISDALANIDFEKLGQKFSGITGIFKAVGNVISWLVDKISSFSFGDIFGSAFEWIQERFQALKDLVSGFDWGKIFKGAAGTGALALIGTKLYKGIKNMTSPFESLKGVGEKINGILEGISGALKSFETKTKVNSFKKIAASILMLAAALLILGFVNYDNAITGIVAIAGIMAGLYAAFNAIGDLDKGKMATMAASMLMAAAAMLVMAVALAALAGALALFTLVSRMDDVADGFAIMAGTLAVALISLKVMSKMSPKVIVAAAALAVFAASLLLLAAAVAAFALVAKMNTVWQGLAVMAAGLLLVVAAMIVLGEVALKALVGAAALFVVSAALLVLAGALAAFSAIAGMETFGTGLAAMALTILILVAALIALGAAGPMVLVGAAAMLVAAAACVVLAVAIAAVGLAMPLLALGLAALGAGIGSALGSIGAGVGTFLTGVSEGITAAGEAIGGMVAEIGSGIGEAVAALGAGVGESISSIIASVGVGIGDGITAISDAIGSFGENLTKAGDGITELGNSIRSLDGISWTSTAIGIGELALALGKLKVDNLATNLGPATTAITTMCNDMVTSIQNAGPEMETAAQTMAESVVTGIQSASPQMQAAAEAMGRSIVSGFNSVAPQIQAAIQSLTSSSSPGAGSVDLSSMFSSMTAAINSAVPQITAMSQQLGMAIATGITSRINTVIAVISTTLSSCVSIIGSYYGSFYGTGANLGAGLANGIQSQIARVASAAASMVESAIRAAREAAQEGSPSKITTQSGIYFGMGYANGILSQRRNVSAAADTMVSGSTKVLNNARTLISRMLEDDFTPVITPVLDTSRVASSLSGISNTTVSARAAVISEGVQSIQSARNASLAGATTNNRTDNVTNLYIDGIKYNTDDYVDSSIRSFVETMTRKQKMYAGG